MPTAIAPAALEMTGHFYTDGNEEVYFSVEITLPRVGRIKVRFHAKHYIARIFNGENDHNGHDGWTNWHVLRDSSQEIPGVGPKGLETMYETVTPLVLEWLESPEYAPSKRREIARFIARSAAERYGVTSANRLLAKYKDEMNADDFDRLTLALEHLEKGAKLLGE